MTQQAEQAAVLQAVPTGLFIGGAWRKATDGSTIAVEDPATEAVLTEVASATTGDALDALDAAVEAAPAWAASTPNERSELLWRAFDTVRTRAEDLALLMTLEMGKPLGESRGEVAYRRRGECSCCVSCCGS